MRALEGKASVPVAPPVPLISVVIAAYNYATVLLWALDSVLSQWAEDIELLVVNDGSRDHTAQGLQKYAQRFPGRVHIIHQENAGPAAARNHGIRIAHGKYVLLLDAGRTASDAYAQPKSLLDPLAASEPLQALRTDPGEPYRQMLNRIRLFISAYIGLGVCDPELAQRSADSGRAFVENHHSYKHLAEKIAGVLAEPWPAIPSPSYWRALRQRLCPW